MEQKIHATDAMTEGLRRLGYTEIADIVELQKVVEVQNELYIFNHREEEDGETAIQVPADRS